METILSAREDIHALDVGSSAFIHRNYIPKKYTCDGENINPPLVIRHIPAKAKSLVIIVDDPDAPVRTWTHWLVWNIPVTGTIRENSEPGEQGLNDFREHRYNGPCPPSGLHYYHFKVYALDSLLRLSSNITRHELEKKMSSHVLAFGEIVGLYKREGRGAFAM